MQVGNKVQGAAKDAKNSVGNPLKDVGNKAGDVGKVSAGHLFTPAPPALRRTWWYRVVVWH